MDNLTGALTIIFGEICVRESQTALRSSVLSYRFIEFKLRNAAQESYLYIFNYAKNGSHLKPIFVFYDDKGRFESPIFFMSQNYNYAQLADLRGRP